MKRRTKKLGKLEKFFWGENIPVGNDKVQNQVDWGLKKELWATVWVRLKVKVKATQSCLALCNSMDCSLQGSSVHEILQARILEWEAFPFSRGSSQPRAQTLVSCIAGGFFTVWARSKDGGAYSSPWQLPSFFSFTSWMFPALPLTTGRTCPPNSPQALRHFL